MRYVLACFRAENREMAFRSYVADSLFYMGENKRLQERYIEMISRKTDDRSADEIVADVIQRAGLRLEDAA